MLSSINAAKVALDYLIDKSRVHLYKPIQIAEILFHHRTCPSLGIDLNNLETYRNPSKTWRNDICKNLLGRICTSGAKYQDSLFEKNAIPPSILAVLGPENVTHGGIVEAYIYDKFESKHRQIDTALNYCLNNNKDNFDLEIFLNQFQEQSGLKRSIDKIFEIVVYALFEVLTVDAEVKIDLYYPPQKAELLKEFSDFSAKVLNLTPEQNRKTTTAHFHRVGVTNAADRGLDMYANFGSAVQIKHISLDEKAAEGIVSSITSHKIIIVCKDADKHKIETVLSHVGWGPRIQAIITTDELINWYKKALQGKFSNILGSEIISTLSNEIKNEFPSVGNDDFNKFKNERGYNVLSNDYWGITPH